MRTRIALVATIPVALIIVLTQAVSTPSAQAETHAPSVTRSSRPVVMPPNRLGVYRARSSSPPARPPVLIGGFNALLLSGATTPSGTDASTPAKAVAPPPAPEAVPAPAPAPAPVDTVTPYERAAWSRVAYCEEGGDWSFNGPVFSGGLGISRSNWVAFGGEEFAAEGAMATEDQQIMVAERIQAEPPDQYGCRGW